MADRAITGHTAITASQVDTANDLFEIVDVSDTTDAPTGTNKKMTVAEVKKLSGRIVLHKNTNIVVGGGTSETLVYSFLIPGGTILAGDVLEIAAVFSKTGGAGNGIMRFKFHTLNQLSGATDVAHMQTVANASVYNEAFRRIFIKGSNSAELMFPYVAAAGVVSSETLNLTITGLNPAVNFANDAYFIVSLQRSSAADSVTMESLVVEIIR
ncbi:MAG TPA: hypothetical protein PKV24_21420 [Cyclobacteriaceae bacterium]|nr:hypothetical protein [Cyclobacteriaceae bacterium]